MKDEEIAGEICAVNEPSPKSINRLVVRSSCHASLLKVAVWKINERLIKRN